MKEIKDIIKAYERARQQGLKTALATVVHVEGSSYRRPGARMLVTETGEITGAISGGCLEGDALRKARLVISQHKALLVTYDTMDDDDAKLGVGLGCNGIIHILIEPILDGNPQNPILKFKDFLSKRQETVLITLFCLADRHAAQPGTCLMLKAGGNLSGKAPYPELETTLALEANQVLVSKTSRVNNYLEGDRVLTAFLEFLQPGISLVIAGAGNDIIPLVEMAGILGWDTTVVDGRHNYATKERFPKASRVLHAKATKVLDHLEIDSQTVFLLMTHNYHYDLALLQELLNRGFTYTGVLGPKKKIDRMLDDLAEIGIMPDTGQQNNIFGPVGLDIGAETSEEIALSILAEIKAVLSKKEGRYLRDKTNTIHPRHPLSEIPRISPPQENLLLCSLTPQTK
ncbi:MAG: XdhC family protein [Adhaeribacter sp.]